MWRTIKYPFSFVKNALTFLQTGVAPENTPSELIESTKNMNHLSSKKFFIVLISVSILSFFYFVSVGIMFLLPDKDYVFSSFVTIFSKSIEILAIIIASYVGAQAVVDLKYSSSSKSETITNSENVSFLNSNAKEDDYEV